MTTGNPSFPTPGHDPIESYEETIKREREKNLLFCLDELKGRIGPLVEIVAKLEAEPGQDKRRENLRNFTQLHLEEVETMAHWLSLFVKASRSTEIDRELVEEIKKFWARDRGGNEIVE